MRRREFLGVLGGAAAWPVAARAQQIRRVGVLSPLAADDPAEQARFAGLQQGLRQTGWIDGRNLRIEYRASVDDDQIRRNAADLVALAPDVIVVSSSLPTKMALQATRTIPVVFVQVADPVAAGFVASLARPGGNATGFTPIEYGTSAKWLELLKEIAPSVTQAAVLRETANPGGIGQMAALQAAAPNFGIDLTAIDGRVAAEIESAISAYARTPNSGLIVTATPIANVHRELIIALAARHRLPAVFAMRFHVVRGGLVSYGPDQVDPFRRAAGYVDRILKGEKPADLPVQAPTKYELAINLKTAKALGLTVPPALLARADEVIE